MKIGIGFAVVATVLALGSSTQAGAIGGPRVATNVVSPGDRHYYDINFRAGDPILIRVQGDGDGDIDCFLYNFNGELVAKDDDATDSCLLMWRPVNTTYRLWVNNTGRAPSLYVMSTN